MYKVKGRSPEFWLRQFGLGLCSVPWRTLALGEVGVHRFPNLQHGDDGSQYKRLRDGQMGLQSHSQWPTGFVVRPLLLSSSHYNCGLGDSEQHLHLWSCGASLPRKTWLKLSYKGWIGFAARKHDKTIRDRTRYPLGKGCVSTSLLDNTNTALLCQGPDQAHPETSGKVPHTSLPLSSLSGIASFCLGLGFLFL